METQFDIEEELGKHRDEFASALKKESVAQAALEEARAMGDAQRAAAAKTLLDRQIETKERIRAAMPKLMEMKQAEEQHKAQKQQALQQLATGGFRILKDQPIQNPETGEVMGYTKTTDLQPTRNSAAQLISQALDVPIEKVDMSRGLTAGDRAILQAVPTDEERIAVIKGKYGEENVSAVNIDGKITPVVRKQDGTVVLADEMGASIADLVDFGVGAGIEAPKIGAAVLASMATAPSVVGTAAAGSAAYSGVGAAQDELIRSALGLENRPLETAGRRGIEFALGTAIDTATLGTGKYIAGRMAKPVRNQMVDELAKAQTVMKKAGHEVDLPLAAQFGEDAMTAAQRAAGMRPDGSLARRMKKAQEVVVDMMNSMVNRKPSKEGYENLLRGYRDEIVSLSNKISGKARETTKIIENFYQRKADAIRIAREDRTKVGETLRSALEDAKAFETGLQTQAFQGIYDEADRAGFAVAPEELANFIRSKQLNTRGMPIETKESKEIIDMLYGSDEALFQAKQLRDMAAKDPMLAADESIALKIAELEKKAAPKGLADLHAMRQQLADKIADGGAPGAGISSNAAKKLNAYMNEFIDLKLAEMDNVLASSGAQNINLAGRWRATNAEFDEKLAFGRGALGRILRQKLGADAITPEAVAGLAISSKTHAADILGTLAKYDQEAGSAAEPQIRQYLQSAYLDKIGLTKKKGVAPRSLDYDSEMIDVLFGNGVTGSGARFAGKLDRLNKTLLEAKINPADINRENVDQLFKTLDQRAEKAVIDTIVARERAEAAKSQLIASRVVQMAKERGNRETIPTDKLAEALFNDTVDVSDAIKVSRRMSQPERKQLQQDAMQMFFERYSNGGRVQAESATQLWDFKSFLADTKTKEGRRFAQKMKTILGDQTYEKLYAASVVSAASYIPTKEQVGMLRAVAGPSGESPMGFKAAGYIAGNIADNIKSRMLSMAYGTKALDPILESMARAGGEAETERLVNKAFARIITTSKGLQAIGMEATKDPEFAVDVADYMNRIAEIEEKYAQQR